MSKQKTLKGSFSLCGKGLHTGLSLTVTFNPAPENTGYKIQRIDLEGEPVIQAVAENVVETQRGTVLGKGDIRVSTIEHGMSALYALGIDNCLIQVNGPEFPILDGSAAPYVEKIQSVGIQEQNAEKDYYIIRHKIEVKDNNGSVITILPDEDFSITAMCSFESKFINSQFATLEKMETYAEEIASARTFVFVRDIMPLLQANLIKGGDLDNAIVIYERQVEQAQLDQLADHLKVPHMDANKLGYIQHRPLQWENECTRHKLLDIIGDMALIGKPIKGRIIATRPGHTVNNKFARLMRKEIRKHEIHEVSTPALRLFQLVQYEQTATLCHRLYLENAWHYWLLWEVTGEEWLVAGYVLNAHDAGRTHSDDLINQLHWVAMRQELADADVIHDWLLVWIRQDSSDWYRNHRG